MSEAVSGESLMSILKKQFSNKQTDLNEIWEEQLERETNNVFDDTLEKLYENKLTENSTELVDALYYIRAYLSKMEIYENKDRLQSYYLGVWETLYRMQFEIINKSIEENIIQNLLSTYKHVKRFIQYLYTNSMPTQREVAEYLGIEVNTLSNFLGRINKYSLYSVQKLGKQKHFSITQKGCLLYKSICEHDDSCEKIDYQEFFIRFLKSLSEETRSEVPSIDNVFTRACPENLKNPLIKKPYLARKYVNEILYSERTNSFSYDYFKYFFISYKCSDKDKIEKLPMDFNSYKNEDSNEDIIYNNCIVNRDICVSNKNKMDNENKYIIFLKGVGIYE